MQKISLTDINLNREFCICSNLMNFKQEFKKTRYDFEDVWYTTEIFKILECPACENITIILYSKAGSFDEDDYLSSEKDYRNLSSLELSPLYNKKLLHTPKKQLDTAIPDSINEVIQQAKSVLDNSPRASFILCRAAMEEICNNYNIPFKYLNNQGKTCFINLKNRLIKLFGQEQIPQNLITLIEGIRELGNEGAHSDHLIFSDRVTNEDAKSLVDIVSYVMEMLYANKINQQKAEKNLALLTNKILPSKGL